MKAFVFARPSSPRFFGQEFGHVGWGFQVNEEEYVVGAVENLRGLPVSDPDKMDFWSSRIKDPFTIFSVGPLGIGTRYDVYKSFEVTNPDIDKALEKMEWVRQRPYNVVHQNCMHSVFDVLYSFGATHIPDPNKLENIVPVTWYRRIGVPSNVLLQTTEPIDIAVFEHPCMEGNVKRFIGSQAVKIPNLKKEKIGFDISSLIVKSGIIMIYDDVDFKGNKKMICSGEYYHYLDAWDNKILSIELHPSFSGTDARHNYMTNPAIKDFDFNPDAWQEVLEF